ncbi:Chromosome segregation ATPase [Natrarchaeobaculum sulfurireducens]|uniref:Chromosome segregation ATPase n=2 Tax=Natrarchaeobaculum sulfurireducens TaxID=2044521 RepID=A0A346PHI7_9EURY|nr:Chromosome segregation ATPase [Natrarchaeobaculum sulfurireducens]
MQDKMSIVFDDLEDDVIKWSEAHADAVNRSAYQLQEYATSLQDTFVPMGFARDEAAGMSQELTELAIDLASFNNMSEDAAMSKLESGLMGQHRALRDFGVAINESRLEQELMNKGMADSVQEASEQEKMMARMSIIMSDTADAQGDAARTSDSFANKMRGLRADTEELRAEIGQHLIPAATSLVGRVSGLVSWFGELSDSQQRTVITAGGLAAVLGPLLIAAGTFLTILPTMAAGWGMVTGAVTGATGAIAGGLVPSLLATNAALLPITAPIWTVIAAIGALIIAVGGLHYAWTNNVLGIRDAATDAFGTVRGWFESAPGWMLALLGPLGTLYYAWRENLFGVQDIVGSVFGWIGDKIDWLRDQIERIPGVGDDDGISQDDIVADDVDEPDVNEDTYAEAFGDLGETSGQSFGESFAESVVDGLETDDAEAHLEDEIAGAEQRLSELQEGGVALEDQEEAADLQREIRDLEGQLSGVQNADGIEDVDPDLLADAAQAQVDAEEERQNTLAAVADRIGGADVERADHGEATPEMVADSLDSGPEQADRGSTEQGLTEETLMNAFMTALEQWSEGRKFRMEQSINERRFRGLFQDEADVYFD